MSELGHIRVVDDEPMICEFICEIASDLGYSVSCTSEAVTATDWTIEPDILFLDLSMPGADGIELIRSLAAAEFRGSIVLISGYDRRILSSAEGLAREHGLNAAGTLSKPISTDALETIIGNCQAVMRPTPSEHSTEVEREELCRALAEGEIVPFYQPKISLATGQVTGFEALARWKHPQRGVLAPNVFLPAIEKYGLFEKLTWQIIDCVQADRALLTVDGNICPIAVNLDASNLTDLNFPDRLENHVRRAGAAPESLQLEVTEGKVFDKKTKALDLLTRLCLRGFKLSIDDFGTGHSSLERLRHVPFSELKIDRSFVSEINQNGDSAAIVESTIRMARTLALKIVAEGVETESQAELLASWGCSEMQGYLIAPAMDTDDCRRWLKARTINTPSDVLHAA